PLPATKNADAATAFRRGIQALRDGSWESARRAFHHAAELDPAMAEASLRDAILTLELHEDAHAAMQSTLLLRNTLPPRAKMLFDAFDVVIRREVPDWKEHERMLGEEAAQWPN